jgi:NADP-dependent 3-hydroxy acid dehydrogenase YdfG
MTQETQHRAPVLKGRRIIVLGACCGFGRSISGALRAAGAQVVVADTRADALKEITGAVPLALKGAPQDALRRVGRAWGGAQLDAVLNLMPLRHPGQIDLNIAVLQSLVQGFMPALCAREGQILTVVSRPNQPLEIAAGAMAPALLSAQAAYADALRRDGLSLNLISLPERAVTPARATVLGMLAGSLGRLSGTELRL